MNEQPEALRLINNRQNAHLISWQANACAELRRLHEVNQELLRVLELTLPDLKGYWEDVVRAAIAKATGEKA